jgi:hypothetical protein
MAALALAFTLPAISAQAAARDRVFVASYGSDSNPCTFGSPCKTFQQAVNLVAAGGEVTAIDSAGFGPILISHAVTITSPNGIEAGIATPANGNAITINAGSTDAVVLQGLTLNGAGIANNGIVFNTGGSLTVTNCTMENFIFQSGHLSGAGILITPNSGSSTFTFDISNTVMTNSQSAGLIYDAPSGSTNANIIIDHVAANGNGTGIILSTDNATGGKTNIAVSNGVISNNNSGGIIASGTGMILAIDSTVVSGNGISPSPGEILPGIGADGTAHVQLSRSTIIGNGYGVSNTTNPNTFYSYGNNQINGNVTQDIDTNFPGSHPPMTIATQ